MTKQHSKPQVIRVDNGLEFVSHVLQQWCEEQQITLQFIQPGRPMQKAYVERKNGSLRRELLDAYPFYSLQEVRILCEQWRIDYNENRPHKALNYLTPTQYAQQLYPQMANANLKVEESRLVDKAVEKTNVQNPNPLVSN